MKIPRSTPPKKKRRSFMRFFVTITVTTMMVTTGGFGAFPNNPITTMFQQQIGQNFSAAFLNPLNSYLDNLSVPTIQPQPASGSEHAFDLVGTLAGSVNSPVPMNSTLSLEQINTSIANFSASMTAAATGTLLQTETPIPTLTTAPTITLIPTASETATLIPTWTFQPIVYPTKTKKPPPPPDTATFTPSPPCSISSATAVNTVFVNSSATQTVNLYWVDYSCALNLFATLTPGQTLGVGTYLTHAWRFTDALTGQLIGDYVVSAVNETVDVSNGVVTTPTPNACIAASNIVSIPGENWYFGNANCSCDDVCASQGGVNATVFDTVGDNASGGTNAKCDQVLTLFLGGGTTADWAAIGAFVGCHLDLNGNLRARYINEIATTSAAGGNVQRVCSCNN